MSDFAETVGTITIAVVTFITIIICIAGIGLLLAFPIKWTWNAVIPYLFGLPILTWGKAWCLNFLCGVLLKGTASKSSK